ncbi:hypothetical protein G3O08_04400 [Cryomorpha ignava]|uniref:Lipoprotein n=1 Tax=Cryomorpha ignava TaxID=101383 RepID=A0A7K3WM71_9FLAO|nr:hypothetical protein [Cryomorpha ignava]NEN22746.1 hypothetical protein [Cryomorpha ignava]
MRNIFATLLAFIVCILVSCDYSERDIADPRLPRYTEQGANTAGCVINEKVWFDPCYFGLFPSWTSCDGLTVACDSLLNYSELRFSGGYYSPGFEDLESLSVVLRLPSKQIRNLGSLRALIGSELPIDGTSVSADLITDGVSLLACSEAETVQTGKVFFRSDGSDHKAFAGTFGFSASNDCGRYDVFYGRFDYDVTQVNFISLN